MRRGRGLLGALLAVFAVMAAPAAAALPGNGRVAVISGELGNGRIWLVQPDGSRRDAAHVPAHAHRRPVVS